MFALCNISVKDSVFALCTVSVKDSVFALCNMSVKGTVCLHCAMCPLYALHEMHRACMSVRILSYCHDCTNFYDI